MGGTYGDPVYDAGRGSAGAAAMHHTDESAHASSEHPYVEVAERLSGRAVLAFICDFDAGPDLWVELFWLAPRPAGEPGPPQGGPG